MSRAPARHDFEGEQLTVAEIRRRVPILSDRSIRDHLQAGRRTRSAMLSFDPAAASARGGRIAAARARVLGHDRAITFGRKQTAPLI